MSALFLKASVPKQHRGFKSLHFRTRAKIGEWLTWENRSRVLVETMLL